MKYAFMSFSTPELSLSETLETARRLGYEGFEPRVDRKHAHGIELERTSSERKAIARQATRAGIEICCLAVSAQFIKASPELLDETRRHIELAADIGCSRIRVFGGSLAKGMERKVAIEIVADGLSRSAEVAESAGVTLCLETHDAWTHPAHVAEVLERVNHPNIAVNWDIMHPFRTSRISMQRAFQTLKPWLHHVHVHDGTLADPLILKPCGDGEIDVKTAFDCLIEHQYEGFISGEWIDSGSAISLAEEISRMKLIEMKLLKQVQQA